MPTFASQRRVLQAPSRSKGSDPASGTPSQSQAKSQPQSQPQQEPSPAADSGKQQMGEGSYEGTREYNKRTADYLKKADVQADAEKAKPQSQEEAREMKQAEDEGRSHSKGEH